MIIDRMRKLIAEQFGVDEFDIEDDANIIEDFCTTPMDRVDIAMAIEDKFGISVSDEELSELATLSEIADYVESNL